MLMQPLNGRVADFVLAEGNKHADAVGEMHAFVDAASPVSDADPDLDLKSLFEDGRAH